MGYIKIPVTEFIELTTDHPVLDVRSPGEFIHAHIPNANSLPLFTDEERKIVGTAYKQESREKAIKNGLELFGPKMVKMVEEVEKICSTKKEKTVLVHCWRGGMRSAAVAWLLDLDGFKVYLLEGGYKAFRNWVLQQFEKDYNLKVIGGYTGSGKTELLAEMRNKGELIIDLEALANHKGSAFGGIGQGAQPSPEMFENTLAIELSNSSKTSAERTIWIEDESQRIGNINIPISFWKLMRSKPVVFLDIPFDERLNNIIEGYGNADKGKLENAITRISKRLGGLETKAAINCLGDNDVKGCFSILLSYYDKWYKKGLHSRDNFKDLVFQIESDKVDHIQNAQLVLQTKRLEQNV
jgi:tRNA 2-selenouridine synthase